MATLVLPKFSRSLGSTSASGALSVSASGTSSSNKPVKGELSSKGIVWKSSFGKCYDKAYIEEYNDSTAKHQLNRLVTSKSLPYNRRCADCSCVIGGIKSSWASVTFGVFLCIRCASYHRECLSTSTIGSITKGCSQFDLWSPDEIQNMQNVGNARAKRLYYHSYYSQNPSTKPPPIPASDASDEIWHKFLINKYVHRMFTPQQQSQPIKTHHIELIRFDDIHEEDIIDEGEVDFIPTKGSDTNARRRYNLRQNYYDDEEEDFFIEHNHRNHHHQRHPKKIHELMPMLSKDRISATANKMKKQHQSLVSNIQRFNHRQRNNIKTFVDNNKNSDPIVAMNAAKDGLQWFCERTLRATLQPGYVVSTGSTTSASSGGVGIGSVFGSSKQD